MPPIHYANILITLESLFKQLKKDELRYSLATWGRFYSTSIQQHTREFEVAS